MKKLFLLVCKELRIDKLCEFYVWLFNDLNRLGKYTVGILSFIVAPIILFIIWCMKFED